MKRGFFISLLLAVISLASSCFAFYLLFKSEQPIVTSLPIFEEAPVSSSPVNITKLLKLINKERKQKRLPQFTENKSLTYIAYIRCNDMFDNQEYTHEATRSSLSYARIMNKIGSPYSQTAENLIIGYDNEEKIVEAWKNSKRHNDILFSKNIWDIGIYSMRGVFLGKEKVITTMLIGK